MGDRLVSKVAVITGSTSGIGRATAELFAQQGARVIVNGRRKGLGEEVVEDIRSRGGTAHYFQADVSEGDQLCDLVRFAVETHGGLDILMNNAFSGESASVVEMEEEAWDAIFAVTVKAAFLGSKYAIPKMIQGGGGVIINTSSVHGLLGGRKNVAYDAVKAALINMTRQMAVDYGQYGIRVNVLCPGRIVTEKKVEMLETHPEEVRRQKFVYPLGRPGTMGEAASAALFLASEDASFVTGHALVVDGGLTAQLQDAAAAHVEEGLLEELGGDQA